MVHAPQADKLISLGCDYITGTVPEESAPYGLETLGVSLMRMQEQKGNQVKPWGMSGFSGFKCGSVELGMRGDERMLRLSGDSAFSWWKQVYNFSANVTRFDLQATLRVVDGPTKRIEKHRRSARADARKGHDKKIVRWIADNRGGYTLYLGHRDTFSFGRIYDRFGKTQLDHDKGTVRYEVQFQKRLAGILCSQLARDDAPLPAVASYVSTFFERRGVVLELPANFRHNICVPRTRSDDDRALEWLAKSVRPSVQRLIARSKRADVLRVLGLT